MTHKEFNELYRSGKIVCKFFHGEKGKDYRDVEAFEYCGKFYLRLHSVHPYTIERNGKYGPSKKYAMTSERHFIKEFDNKQKANNYYKKFVEGWKMEIVSL